MKLTILFLILLKRLGILFPIIKKEKKATPNLSICGCKLNFVKRFFEAGQTVLNNLITVLEK